MPPEAAGAAGSICYAKAIAINGRLQTPTPVSVSPASGTPGSQPLTFVFTDPSGYAYLQVLDVLINNALDGRHACYVAFLPTGPTAGTVFLVEDAGDAGGPYQGLTLPGSGTVSNGQCTIKGVGSSVTSGSNNLTLALAMTFGSSFAGNKIVYLAARDTAANNSGWQALGTLSVPGASYPEGPLGPAVIGAEPGRSTQSTVAPYAFTFTDSNGWRDIAVANILVNSAIDGRQSCYLAIVPTSAASAFIMLVDNAGNAGGPYAGMAVPGAGTVSNGQCTITGAGSTVSASGTTLRVTLQMSFDHSFAGNRVFFVAARSSTLNSDWQAVGTISVP